MLTPVAAIDVGSNAIRLVIGQVDSRGLMTPVKKLREPIRLGKDVFSEGYISEMMMDRAVTAFHKFRSFLMASDVEDHHVRAVATSAVREASNGKHFVATLREETGIELEVINPQEEALLIHNAVQSELNLKGKPTLLMDIGGGSVEFMLSHRGTVQDVISFKMGTVRSLLSSDSHYEGDVQEYIESFRVELRQFIRRFPYEIEFAVGTGGNIVCLGELRSSVLAKKNTSYIKHNDIEQLIHLFLELGYEGRIRNLGLREDRADVILPASFAVKMLLEESRIKQMLIPKVGLKDGLLSEMAQSAYKQA